MKSTSNNPYISNKLGYIYLFIGIFTWSTIEITLTLIKNESTSPIIINIFRMLIGGITLLIYIIISGRIHQFKIFIKKFPRYYVPASVLGLIIGQIIFVYGTNQTEPQIAATIFSSNPVIIALYMMLFQNESKSKIKIFGVILGFFGVIVVITELNFKAFMEETYLKGNILVFIGMCFWIMVVIFGKLLFNQIRRNSLQDEDSLNEFHFDSLDYNAITFLLAGIAMIPLIAIPGEIEILKNSTAKAWLGILWLGIVAGGIGYLAFFKGIEKIEASKGINAFYFKPIFSIILSFLIFNITPEPVFYIGLIIEIVALVLVSYQK